MAGKYVAGKIKCEIICWRIICADMRGERDGGKGIPLHRMRQNPPHDKRTVHVDRREGRMHPQLEGEFGRAFSSGSILELGKERRKSGRRYGEARRRCEELAAEGRR